MAEQLTRENGIEQHQLVYVVDDDIAIRRSLHFLLSTANYTSWPFACAFDFLENLTSLRPAPILLDIRMPEIDGIDVMSELSKRENKWPVIVITAHADIPVAVQAIRHGAIDLLEKPLEFDLLERSLRDAMFQLSKITGEVQAHNDAQCLWGSLSLRENQVMMILMGGCPNKVAAHRLSLSVRTVEMYRANALLKLKVRSIAEVIRIARDAGTVL